MMIDGVRLHRAPSYGIQTHPTPMQEPTYMPSAQPFREILIFVAGATPQIITETIYALAMQDPPVYADELHVITTTAGSAVIQQQLITAGRLQQLYEEYRIPPASAPGIQIVLVTDPAGNPLEDIRTAEDNESAGDQISAFIRSKATESGTRLHCSLAGGRKTMSFYLGAALQLFGRPQDRLYHVLISSGFEANPNFYYPPRIDTFIESRLPDGTMQQLNAREAVVQLAELPFVRLGELGPRDNGTYRELVQVGQHEVNTSSQQPFLQVNIAERTLRIGSITVELIPVQLMLYLAFLRQKTDHCKYPERVYCRDCTGCYDTIVGFASREALAVMVRDYAAIYAGNPNRVDDLMGKWPEGIEVQSLRAIISKINRTIREQLGDDRLATIYTVATDRKYAGSRYGVKLEKSKIQITGVAI